jgi:hypothetical protein
VATQSFFAADASAHYPPFIGCKPQVLGRACHISTAEALDLSLLPAQGQHPGDELPQLELASTHITATPSAGQADAAAAAVAPGPLQELLAGRVRCVEYSGGHVFVDAPRGPGRVYLPGSFNPLHEGHKQMLAAAVKLAGPDYEGCFELTVKNADKVRAGWMVGVVLGQRGGGGSCRNSDVAPRGFELQGLGRFVGWLP